MLSLTSLLWLICHQKGHKVLVLFHAAMKICAKHRLDLLDLISWGWSPLLGAYNSHNKPMQRHFYRPVYFSYFSREIDQFQCTWARFFKDKAMQPHVNMSTSYRHVNISPCMWLQLVTEIPVGIWIRDNWIQTKNKSVCENAVTGTWGSCRLLLMSSWYILLVHKCASMCHTEMLIL